jgi:hypothetical protein
VKSKQDGKSLGAGPWCTAAAIVIGHALRISDGSYDRAALWWIAGGILLAWVGFFVPAGNRWGRQATLGVCLAGIIWEIHQLYNGTPFVKLEPPLAYYTVVLPLLAVSAVGAVLWRWGRCACVAVLVGTYFYAGVWMIRISHASPPQIDVYTVNRDSCAALAEGRDPYAIDIPDIYTDRPDWEKAFYPAGLIVNGRVNLGYPYMPLSLLAAFAGHELGGDFRYGNLAAVALAAVLLACAGRGGLGAAGAALLLLTPRGYFVIQYGWAEPVVVLCLAAVVFCALRRPGWLPWAVGLLLASKQHMLLCAPALVTIWPWVHAPQAGPLNRGGNWKFALKAVGIGTVITLPFVLWNFHAFWHSVVQVQLDDPFRFDSLNFAAGWAKLGHVPPGAWVSFGLGILAAGLAMWRAERSAAGFAVAVAVIYLSFFALSKQTFCNYYFLAIGALCCCVAAGKPTGGYAWALEE